MNLDSKQNHENWEVKTSKFKFVMLPCGDQPFICRVAKSMSFLKNMGKNWKIEKVF
jgi:hypothetical protein